MHVHAHIDKENRERGKKICSLFRLFIYFLFCLVPFVDFLFSVFFLFLSFFWQKVIVGIVSRNVTCFWGEFETFLCSRWQRSEGCC